MTTAKTHLENIFQKTGVKRQAEPMRLAARAGPRPSAERPRCRHSEAIAALVHVAPALVIDERGAVMAEVSTELRPNPHEYTGRATGALTLTLGSAAL